MYHLLWLHKKAKQWSFKLFNQGYPTDTVWGEAASRLAHISIRFISQGFRKGREGTRAKNHCSIVAVDRIMDLPKDIYILILKPANMLTIWKKKRGGIRLQMELKLLISLPWDGESVQVTHCNLKVLTSERGGSLPPTAQDIIAWEGLSQWSWLEDRGMGRDPGTVMASRRWKMHGSGFSPKVSRRNIALPMPWF